MGQSGHMFLMFKGNNALLFLSRNEIHRKMITTNVFIPSSFLFFHPFFLYTHVFS